MKKKVERYRGVKKEHEEPAFKADFQKQPEAQDSDCWSHLWWRVKIACPWLFRRKK